MSYSIESNEKPATKEDAAAKKIIETAKEEFKESVERTAAIRTDALDDIKFRKGEHWPSKIQTERTQDDRPCLTINKLPQFERIAANDLRKNRPAIMVNPVNDDSDIETAEVIQGAIRHIEYESRADMAYDTAGTCAIRNGFGYIRVITEYEDSMSFDQVIRIKRVRNPFSVYFGPANEPDYSDARVAFVTNDMPKATFCEEFGESKLAKTDDWSGIGDMSGWVDKDTCRVVEYFKVERENKTLIKLNDGSVMLEEDLPPNGLGEGYVIVDRRKTFISTVKWRKLNGIEILEETEWLGSWIPIVPVLGDEIDEDGVITLESIIRHAKDPQRMYDYWASAETEMIALAPKAPWVGAAGQFAGRENTWRDANRKTFPYLEYEMVSNDGKLAPPPQRQVYEAPVQAINQARMNSSEDIKATIGMYDPTLGAVSNESSGRAILLRQQQGDNVNFHFGDNQSRAISHVGRIVLELIPKIYDGPRVMQMISESGEHSSVKVNQEFTNDKGEKKNFDFAKGKYGVRVQAGPSYQTKRQEASAAMQEVVKAYPPLMEKAGDLLIKHFDWPGAQELADRLKPMDDADLPAPIKQKMQQDSDTIKMLSNELNSASQKLENRQDEIASKERIAIMKERGQMQQTLAKLEAAAHGTAFEHEMKLAIAHLQGHMDLAKEHAKAELAPPTPTTE